MQNAAVSYYAYNDPQQGFAGGVYTDPYYGHMSKRRRIDDGEPEGIWPPEGRTSQQYPPTTFDSSAAYAAASHDNGTGEGALNESSDPVAQQWHRQSASPYPDVSSYQQPYFYQQTDPSTYTSPWPPSGKINAYGGNSGIGMVHVPSGSNMPLFPTPHSQVNRQDDGYASNPSFQRYPESESNEAQQTAYGGAQNSNDASKHDSGLVLEDASVHLKLQSLSILENLATQLIHTIAKASFGQIQDMMRGNETEESQAYMTLKNLFDQTRKVYSRETPFIDAITIQMFQPTQQEVIRKANIATFISSILGAHDVSFFHLNEFFMETFVPLGHRLLKWQGAIYLELKTQTYISALMNSDGNPEAMLDELFPHDMDAQILTRHPDAPSLSPSEQDFIDRSKARKSYLLAEPATEEDFRELSKKYQWNDFVREFAGCINKNVDGIMNVPARAQPSFGGPGSKQTKSDLVREASAMQNIMSKNGQTSSVDGTPIPGLPTGSQPPANTTTMEKKPSSSATTVRQPWTKPEEDALLAGLDKVNGPHWSQILALYGRGGSVSEVLKDRNQVQLKDKARNLKLWYLKMGKELPVALKGVTGELRKRGGARARAALELLNEDAAGGSGTDGAAAEDGVGEGLDRGLDARQGAGGRKAKTKGGWRR